MSQRKLSRDNRKPEGIIPNINKMNMQWRSLVGRRRLGLGLRLGALCGAQRSR
jgi:hypothetical protein